jgi:molybdopterin-synthase adenylyltransferase
MRARAVRKAQLKESFMKLKITERAWADLRAQLFARTDLETAGLMLVESTGTRSDATAVVREAFALPESAYIVRHGDQLSIDPVALNRLTRPARDRGWGVFTIHTHPGAERAWFSCADDVGDARLMPALACQMPCAPLGSLVVVENGDVIARRFVEGALREVRLHVVGRTISVPRAQAGEHETPFARQEHALGAAGQSRLRAARIGIVGLGGIGSLISMQLAHLGVGELVLIDGDHVEESNLSRIVGATHQDLGVAKVDVAARYARNIGFTRVQAHALNLAADNANLLTDCDAVVSCVDLHTPRAILNRIAYRFHIPMVDLGTVFRIEATGSIVGDAGRVVVVGPGRPCLCCWGHIDPHALRTESLEAGERDRQEREGYIEGALVDQPSVISFNTLVAGSGATEIVRLLTGFAGIERPPLRLAFSFRDGTVSRNSLVVAGMCGICDAGERATGA